MPQEWFDRMHTIQTYDEEVAAQGRLYAWGNGIRLANENFLGGGFRAVAGYGGTDSHSIYFGVLGEHGWVGLSMFLLLILFTWRSAAWLMASGRRNPDLYWARDLGSMVQVGLVGYAAGGAFLSLAYFDLPYNMLIMVVLAKKWVESRGWERDPAVPFLEYLGIRKSRPKDQIGPGARIAESYKESWDE